MDWRGKQWIDKGPTPGGYKNNTAKT